MKQFVSPHLQGQEIEAGPAGRNARPRLPGPSLNFCPSPSALQSLLAPLPPSKTVRGWCWNDSTELGIESLKSRDGEVEELAYIIRGAGWACSHVCVYVCDNNAPEL